MRRRSGRRQRGVGLRGAVLASALALLSPDGLAGEATAGGATNAVSASPATTTHVKGFALHVDDRLAGSQREFTFERIKPSALELVSEFRGVKRGVGLDWGLADTGNVHFNFYSGKDGFAHGMRWSVADEGGTDVGAAGDAVAHSGRSWSIGASLDVVRFRSIDADGARDSKLIVSPQLLLDVGELTGFCAHCEMLVQGTMWRGADSRATETERVVQVSMKWRF